MASEGGEVPGAGRPGGISSSVRRIPRLPCYPSCIMAQYHQPQVAVADKYSGDRHRPGDVRELFFQSLRDVPKFPREGTRFRTEGEKADECHFRSPKAGGNGNHEASDPHPPGGGAAHGQGDLLRRPQAGKRSRESPGAPSEKSSLRGAASGTGSCRVPSVRVRVQETGPAQGAVPMSGLQGRSDLRPVFPHGRRS